MCCSFPTAVLSVVWNSPGYGSFFRKKKSSFSLLAHRQQNIFPFIISATTGLSLFYSFPPLGAPAVTGSSSLSLQESGSGSTV